MATQEAVTKPKRKRRASKFLAFVRDESTGAFTLAAEGTGPEDVRRRCSEAGREHWIVRLHEVSTPRQSLLWGTARGPRVAGVGKRDAGGDPSAPPAGAN